jgi:hypothetical protein
MLSSRFAALPLWAAALVLFAISRVWSTALLLGTYAIATANDWPFASDRIASSPLAFLASWDASFYRRIASTGYPAVLPTAADGSVVPNEWAFLPVFPWLTHLVSVAAGLSVDAAGVILAVVFGAAATVLLALLLRPRVGRYGALWAAALFAFGPVSFVMQVPYAEGLFCALVFASLWAIATRRYLLVMPLAVVAAFTKPGELAIALALGILFLMRLRSSEPFPTGEKLRMLAAGLVSAAAGLAWPLIAGAATGVPGAYLETELSWWTGFVGTPGFTPFTPWFLMAGRYLGIAGILLVVVIAVAFAWWMSRRSVRQLGAPVLAFSASYSLYLLAVFLPQQSIVRLLMPLSPLLGDPAITKSAALRRSLLFASLVAQPIAVVLLWFLGYP